MLKIIIDGKEIENVKNADLITHTSEEVEEAKDLYALDILDAYVEGYDNEEDVVNTDISEHELTVETDIEIVTVPFGNLDYTIDKLDNGAMHLRIASDQYITEDESDDEIDYDRLNSLSGEELYRERLYIETDLNENSVFHDLDSNLVPSLKRALDIIKSRCDESKYQTWKQKMIDGALDRYKDILRMQCEGGEQSAKLG